MTQQLKQNNLNIAHAHKGMCKAVKELKSISFLGLSLRRSFNFIATRGYNLEAWSIFILINDVGVLW